MTLKLKWLPMLLSLLALVAVAGCAAAPTAFAASADPANSPVRQLIASGQGKAYLVPDVAYVTIGVHTESSTVTNALSANNAQAQAIKTALTGLGVDAKDIQTSAFNVYPMVQPNPKGGDTAQATAFAVDNTVNVTVHDLSNLGALLDKVVSSGANSIHGIQFDALDKSKALAQARKLAIQDAMSQAKEIAADSGVTLGDLQNVNASINGIPGPIYAGKGGFAASDASVPVSSGQLVITASASITYFLK